MSAIEAYQQRIDAVAAQNGRRRGDRPAGDRWSGELARLFRQDPHRPLDRNLSTVASYIDAEDTVVDVGGGAGRMSLPLALRCREMINVDPSAGMRAEFEDLALSAGIANARYVQADWLDAEGVRGDVVYAANVTYFVREIGAFIRKMEAAAGRRVIISVWSVPPPAQATALYRVAFDEEKIPEPGHRELLPVLWELGILPDVRVLPERPPRQRVGRERAAVIEAALTRLSAEGDTAAAARIESAFDSLFAVGEDGYVGRWQSDVRELLITWEPDHTGGSRRP